MNWSFCGYIGSLSGYWQFDHELSVDNMGFLKPCKVFLCINFGLVHWHKSCLHIRQFFSDWRSQLFAGEIYIDYVQLCWHASLSLRATRIRLWVWHPTFWLPGQAYRKSVLTLNCLSSFNIAIQTRSLQGKPHFGFHAIGYTYYAPKGVSRGVVDQRWGFLFIQSVLPNIYRYSDSM